MTAQVRYRPHRQNTLVGCAPRGQSLRSGISKRTRAIETMLCRGLGATQPLLDPTPALLPRLKP